MIGYRYDTETGLYYLQSRYYNPEWGRFINADGITDQTGKLLSHNMFAYCQNDPVNAYDPTGFVMVEDMEAGNTSIDYKTFYKDVSGPKITIGGKSLSTKTSAKTNGYNNSTSIFKVQLFSGELGMAKVYHDGDRGNWYVKGPSLSGDISTTIAGASLYATASGASLGGAFYVPIPFTNHKFELGEDVDVLSIGGGIKFNLNSSSGDIGLKFGAHAGIGGDLRIIFR